MSTPQAFSEHELLIIAKGYVVSHEDFDAPKFSKGVVAQPVRQSDVTKGVRINLANGDALAACSYSQAMNYLLIGYLRQSIDDDAADVHLSDAIDRFIDGRAPHPFLNHTR